MMKIILPVPGFIAALIISGTDIPGHLQKVLSPYRLIQ